MMCTRLKKPIAFILIMIMIFQMGVPVFAAPTTEAAITALEAALPEVEIPEGYTGGIAVMGTQSSTVDEEGKYAVTIYRLGDISMATTIELRSIDISAVYGEDYRIDDSLYTVEITGQDGTLLQQSAGNGVSSTQTETAAESDSAAAAEGDAWESTLANEKAEQTGIASRAAETTVLDDTEADLIQSIAQSLNLNLNNQIPSSSVTDISFAANESEKQIIFEVLSDKESEGQEMLSLMLTTKEENLIAQEPLHCTITIEDNEPVVHSELSFSAKKFSAKDGVATVTIERKGAEYAAATAMVKTVENGTAQDGVHYNAQDTLLEFLPYETEKTIDIPMSSSEAVDLGVELYDMKGAVAGKRTVSTVTYKPSRNTDKVLQEQAVGENYKEFTIHLDKEYTVIQENGSDVVGKIVDRSYTPEVTVGEYLFPNNEDNGGTFLYGIYKGDDGWTCHRESKYDKDEKRGYLRWYSTSIWRNGESACYSMPNGQYHIGADQYQYISAHWEMDGGFTGNEARVEMDWPSGSGLPYNTVYNTNKEFSKRMSEGVSLLNKGLPISSTEGRVKIIAIDNKDWETPNMHLYVYGVAAMYRKFKINLDQPDELCYRISEDKKISQPPATVTLGEGHNTRYYGQDLQVQVFPATEGEPVKGTLVGYQVTIGENAKNKVTFTYTPSGDMKNIAIDEEFIRLVDENTKEVQKQGNYGFTTTLTLKPIFEHKTVTINSLASADGSFTDPILAEAGPKERHVGDYLNMGAEANTPGLYYKGYERIIYTNASDTTPLDSGIMEDVGSLLLTQARYDLRPMFGDEINHIEVIFEGEAASKVRVPGLLADSELPDNLKGRHIVAVDPSLGKIYSINAVIDAADAGDNMIWRPVFTMSNSTSKVQGNSLDFIANGRAIDNVITISLEKVSKDAYAYFQLQGTTVYGGGPIRDSDDGTTLNPAIGSSLAAGGETGLYYDQKSRSEKETVNRRHTVSGDNGSFDLIGVYAIPGDTVSVALTNGDLQQVYYVPLTVAGDASTEMNFTKPVYNPETKTTELQAQTETGYLYSLGTLEFPQRTPYTPYVVDIQYKFLLPTSYIYADPTKNQIPILNDTIIFTAMIDTNDKELEAVEFVTRKKSGAILTERVEVKSQGKGLMTVTFSQKMDTYFDSGDQMFMRIVDKEKNTVVIDGTESIMDIVYPEVFTGLSFYVPSIETTPQNYTFEQEGGIEIPVFGNVAAQADTGRLSFKYEKYGDGITDPYALQAFYSLSYGTALKTPHAMLQAALDGSTGSKPDTNEQVKNADETGTPQHAIEAVDKTITETTGKAGKEETNPEVLKEETKQAASPKSASSFFKKLPLSMSFLVALEFDFIYDEAANEYQLTFIQGLIGGSLSGIYTQPFTVYGVPLYAQVQAGVSMQINFIANESKAVEKLSASDFSRIENLASFLEPTCDIQFGINGKVSAGVGFASVISVHGSILGDFYGLGQVNIEKSSEDENQIDWSWMAKAGGAIGADLLVTKVEITIEPTLWKTGAYDTGVRSTTLAETTAEIRDYAEGDGDVSAFGQTNTKRQSGTGTDEVLLGNSNENSRPSIITLPDQRKFMVFLNTDIGDGRNNPSCLMYSICDATGNWSVPAVIQPDNTYDAFPVLKIVNNKVVIAWSNASTTFTDEMSIADKLSTFNLNYCIFDPNANVLDDIKTLAENEFMNVNAQMRFSENGEEMIGFYLKRDLSGVDTDEKMLQNMLDGDASYSTIAFKLYDKNTDTWSEERYLQDLHPEIEDPYLIDHTIEMVEIQGQQIIFSLYTVDEDNNNETLEDRNLYVEIYNINLDKSYPAIRLTNSDGTKTTPQIFWAGNDLYFGWLSDGDSVEMMNVNRILENMETDQIAQIRSGSQTYGWHEAVLESLDMADFGIETERFYDENGDAYPIGNFKFCDAGNDNIYLVWTGATNDTQRISSEVYAAPFYRNIRENSQDAFKNVHAGWGNVVQLTTAGKTIGAYDIATDSKGDLSIVAATYDQEVKPEGGLSYSNHALSYFTTNAEAGITIENNEAWLENPVAQPGEKTALCFHLSNQGLAELKGYDVNITSSVDGSSLASFQSEDAVMTGAVSPVRIPITMPETVADLALNVEVTGNGATASCTVAAQSQPLLKYKEAAIIEDGNQFHFVGTIENTGNAVAEAIIATPSILDETQEKSALPKIQLPSLAPGETKAFNELIEIPLSALNTYGGCLLYLETASLNYALEEPLKLAATKRKPAEISVNGGVTSIEIKKGETLPLEVTLIPANVAQADITKSTANHTVAAIDIEGNIVAVGAGQTELTIVHNATGLTATIPITVTDDSNPQDDYDIDENGNAVINLDAEKIAALQEQSGENNRIVIDLTGANDTVKGSKVTIDQDTMAQKELHLEIILPGGARAFFAGNSWIAGEAPFTIEMRASGEKIQLHMSREGEDIHWRNEKNPIILSIPFALSDGQNPDYAVMAGENETIVSRSWYADGYVSAKLYGSGSYRPVYNDVAPFTDVQGNWMEQAINYLRARNITDGINVTEYGANQMVTRAQYTTLLMRLLNAERGENTPLSFTDEVEIPGWAKEAVDTASALAIATGYEDQTFRPNASILRQEMFTMTYRMMEKYNMLGGIENSKTPEFSDWEQTMNYAKEPIQALYSLGMIQGDRGKLKPLDSATRAEAGQFLFNLLQEDRAR